MRYISKYDNLALYRKNGQIAHKFKNGVLVVGDKTTRNGTDLTTDTKGYVVDYFDYTSTPELEIMDVKPDFAGLFIDESGAVRIECIGLGSLVGTDYSGSALTEPLEGYKGLFFEAPELDNSATLIEGALYEVLSAPVIYDGTTYSAGERFTVVAGTTSFTGAGTVALSILTLENKGCHFTKQAFEIQHLITPNDTIGHWNYGGGYIALDSVQSMDWDFVGRTIR